MIHVLLVDDHDLVRTGVRKMLEDTPDIEVAGEARSGEDAVGLVRQTPPDVILMDVNMPGMGGMEATRVIARMPNETRVIALSMHEDGLFPRKLLDVGAMGYLTKGCSADEVIDAIRAVHTGKVYIERKVAQELAMTRGDDPFTELSQRELEVLRLIVDGISNQDIAAKLHLAAKTVSTYRSRIFDKLGVSSDVDLTHLAYRHGLIDPAGKA